MISMMWATPSDQASSSLLDLYDMLRSGMLVPGEGMSGSINWSRSGSTMRYQALLKENGTGGLRLMF